VTSARGAPVVIGLDIGTSSAKAAAYDSSGHEWSRASAAYPLVTERPGWAEQHPERVLEAATDALAQVASRCREQGRGIEAVALAGAMHSLLAVDRDGRPLTRALTWADGRAEGVARWLRARPDGHQLYRRTGTPLQSMTPLSKVLWFRDHEPDTFRRAARWLSLKDHLVLHATGLYVTDHSLASTTGLFDIMARRWDAPALELAGLRFDELPEALPVTHVVRKLERRFTERAGLPSGVALVLGGSDGALATLGLGATLRGVAAGNVGTSAALRVLVPEPILDAECRSFCYAFTDALWLVGVALSNGGVVLRWLQERVWRGAATSQELVEAAATVPPGAEGLLFLPYLLAERGPRRDPDARACFVGLGIRHGREHMVRAALEGVAFQLRAGLELLESVTGVVSELRVGGGAMTHALWRAILADVLGRPVLYPRGEESACFGAALVGMHALGMIPSLEHAAAAATAWERHEPSEDTRSYARVRGAFDDVARNMRESLARVATLAGELSSGATSGTPATEPGPPARTPPR
jgi:gluconokinase